jgi:hypothetical protein
MAESVIGLARHAREIGLGDGVSDEGPDHFHRHFGIRPAGKGGDFLRAQLRPGFRHIEAAVAGETREHDLDKAERRGLAPGGNVAHDASLGRRPRGRKGRPEPSSNLLKRL